MKRFLAFLCVCALLGGWGCSDDEATEGCTSDDQCSEGFVCGGGQCLARTEAIVAEIVSFDATPDKTTPGLSTTLSWVIPTGRNAVITWGENTHDIPEEEMESGTLEVPDLQEDTVFTLFVDGTENEAEATITVEVRTPEATILSFSLSPESVPIGVATQVRWQISGATEALIVDEDDTTLHFIELEDINEGSWSFRPSESTTLILKVRNEFEQSDEAMATVSTYGGEPKITFFGSTVTSLVQGTSATLKWNVEGADAVRIEDDQGGTIMGESSASEGALEISPAVDTRYTLIATNVNGEDREAISIEVFVPIQISDFSAMPEVIPLGNSVSLSWAVSGGANTVVLQDGSGALVDIGVGLNLTGSVLAQPVEDEIYTLTAGNAAETIQQDVYVTVLPIAPSITEFSASSNPVAPNGTTTLTWETSGSASIALENITTAQSIDVSALDPRSDSLAYSPQAGSLLRLTATNPGGSTSQDLQIDLLSPVELLSFTADQTTVAAGQPITLSWETAHATAISLEAVSTGAQFNLSPKSRDQDSIVVTPSTSETYSFTVEGFQGPVTGFVNVTVIQPPSIDTFASDNGVIRLGDIIALNWTSTGATTATLEDDQNNALDISALSPAQDSLNVTPSNDETTYTLTVNNMAGQATADVTITAVDVDSLRINEVFDNGPTADNGLEWIELYNSGDRDIDLQYFSLGSGGSDYTTSTLQLVGSIAPGGCFVVGGPTSSVDNGQPVFDQTADFSPDIQNGGSTADGIALFFELEADLLATTTPTDSILWGNNNVNNLLGESGSADTVLSPNHSGGESLERVGVGDLFRVQTSPTPNRCTHITTVIPVTTSNLSTGVLQLRGWGLDANHDQVDLGTTSDLSCANVSGGIDCMIVPSSDSGSVDISVTRGSQTVTVSGAVFLEVPTADPGVTFWCGITTIDGATAASSPITLDVEIYLDGATGSGGDLPVSWSVEVAYFDPAEDPTTLFSPTWTPASKSGNNGNNVVYTADVLSTAALVAEAAYRVSPDGLAYYYCDTVANQGSDDGYSTGVGVTWN